MVLNTPSYGGGSDLWDADGGAPLASRDAWGATAAEERSPAANDGVLELVGVTDVLHLALTLGGLSNGMRICQGRTLTLDVRGKGVPLQIDGEPFNVALEKGGSIGACEPFLIQLERCGSALRLKAPAGGLEAREGGEGELAVERGYAQGSLSLAQRDALFAAMSSES